MRRFVVVTGLLAIGAGWAAAGGAPAAAQRQSGSLTFTSTRPGDATGTKLDFTFTNPENPDQKPHTVTRIVVHYPPGTRFDSGALPQCHASDAELQSEGASACPASSKVGSGLAVSDTGSSGPAPPRYTESTITQFNGDHEVIGVGENKDIPAIKTVTHTKIHGTTASTDFPTFPGSPPPDPYTPLKSLKVGFPRIVKKGRTPTRLPPSCPASRHWTITTIFTYADGATGKIVSHSPCGGRHVNVARDGRHRRHRHHKHKH